MQSYLDVAGWAGYLAVPEEPGSSVRIGVVRGTAASSRRASASWCRLEDGYSMIVTIETGRALERGDRFRANLVVNQMIRGRERRAGQLVLSGDAGWVYLRGDREDPRRSALMEVA
jgi:hypothetical protein